MSGHSKWSTIKRQKGVADVKRGATFTKIGNAITIAVKQGGGVSDPEQNPRLRLAIELARSSNMPKDNIERAIHRAKEKGAGELTEVTYEGFAPGGVSVLVEAATDNPNRTTAEVKSLFHKSGASFARPGAVGYQFTQTGEIVVNKNGKTLDEIFLSAADLGATDVEDREEVAEIYTSVIQLENIKKDLLGKGFEVLSAEITRIPNSKLSVAPEQEEKILDFLSELEGMDDVQKVYSNVSLNNQ